MKDETNSVQHGVQDMFVHKRWRCWSKTTGINKHNKDIIKKTKQEEQKDILFKEKW